MQAPAECKPPLETTLCRVKRDLTYGRTICPRTIPPCCPSAPPPRPLPGGGYPGRSLRRRGSLQGQGSFGLQIPGEKNPPIHARCTYFPKDAAIGVRTGGGLRLLLLRLQGQDWGGGRVGGLVRVLCQLQEDRNRREKILLSRCVPLLHIEVPCICILKMSVSKEIREYCTYVGPIFPKHN